MIAETYRIFDSLVCTKIGLLLTRHTVQDKTTYTIKGTKKQNKRELLKRSHHNLIKEDVDSCATIALYRVMFVTRYKHFKNKSDLISQEVKLVIYTRELDTVAVVPTKSDSDVIFCLQLLSKI